MQQPASLSVSERSYEKSGEPLAIVGIGCRLPGGVDDVQGFWRLVRAGENAIIEVPVERWDLKSFYDADANKIGKMHCRRGGFLRRPLDQFDAGFFGMSPREAARLDPQQRMLLEVAWEALEDAGQRPSDLAGSLTGVFIGGFMLDSLLHQLGQDNVPAIESHTATGMTMTMLSARLAYFLDLRGPTISVDTACSSSLVAMHYACTSIWRGESSMVLCGGVNAMLAPAMSIALAKGKLTSPDGHCKAFDASANGYARGEGAGMLIIKTLAQATQDGDHVYAIVRGTAVNQDGRSDHGITHPSKDAQVAVLRTAYARAGVSPNDVHYVEAHGTGTIAGDTTETAALGAVLGAARAASERFVVGSVKTNLGHLEGAAGVTGVIKAALSLHNEQIAPNLHFNEPNPAIPFDTLRIRVPVVPEPWARGTSPRYAGVNSFGYGGTNAHVVLEEAPRRMSKERLLPDGPWFLPLSARSEAALRALATRYADRIDTCGGATHLEDIAHSAGLRRDHHEWRAGFVASSCEAMSQGLRAYSEGKPHPSYRTAHVAEKPLKIAWVFTGMGPQWWGMGRELMQQEPVFSAAVQALDVVFKSFGGWSLTEELSRPEAQSRMDRTEIAMSCNFAIQAGLVALWRSLGLEPDMVVGHSVGEMGSAYASGALSLEDAARVAFFRSSIMQQAAGTGRMLATGLTVDEANALLRGREHLVSVAAINGPANVTLSGDAAALQEIEAALEDSGVFNKFLRVEVPYHSPQMDPLKQALEEALQDLSPTVPRVPLYSTVTAEQVTDASLDNRYWVRNMRESVFFSAVIEKLLADGCTHLVEMGPHCVLSASIAEVAKRAGKAVTCMATMLRKKPERATFLTAVRQLYIDGQQPRWAALNSRDAQYVRIPTYPWQRERHWVESNASVRHRLGPTGHPLIGHRLASIDPIWEAEVNDQRHPYMADHCIAGEVLFPASGYLEAARAMLDAWKPGGAWSLDQVTFRQAFVLGGADATVLRGKLDPNTGTFSLHSCTSHDASTWTLNTSGHFRELQQARPTNLDIATLRRELSEVLSSEAAYAELKRRGYDYGPTFRQVRAVHYRTSQLFLCDVSMPEALLADAAQYTMHPAILDACLHASLTLLPSDSDNTYLPVGVDSLVCYEKLPAQVVVVVKVLSLADGELRADLTICAPDGRVLVEVIAMQAHALGATRGALKQPLSDWLYTHTWQQVPASSDVPLDAEHWLVLDDGAGLGTQVCARAQQLGVRTLLVGGSELHRTLSTLGEFAPTRVISLLDAVLPDADAPASAHVGVDAVMRLARIIQRMAQHPWKQAPQLVVVTRGAEILPTDESPVLGRAAIAGFVRTVMNEHVELRARMLDLAYRADVDEVPMLVASLAVDTHETEMALRGKQHFARRFERATQESAKVYTTRWVSPNATRVVVRDAIFQTLPPATLGDGQVEIQVLAAGVRPSSSALRIRCVSGRIARVGARVSHLQKGAEVVAWADGEMASFVVVDAAHVLPKPLGMSYDAAASADPLTVAHRVLLKQANAFIDASDTVPRTQQFGNLTQRQQTASDVVQISAAPVQALNGSRGYSVHRDGSYLVTGGLGGLGMAMAAWLARSGAGHLILIGRNGAAAPQAQRNIRTLESLGARVTAVAADVANASQFREAVARASVDAPPLRGVIHAASTFSSDFIFQFEPEEIGRQMAAKATGAFNLHAYTQNLELDFFVMISSMAAQIGSHGQSAYAAANAFLDGLCVYRRAVGMVGTSINFGAISDVGILNTKHDYGARLKSVGLLSMRSEQVIESIDFALMRGLDRLTVSNMHWQTFFESFPAMKQAPGFATLHAESQANERNVEKDGGSPSFLARIAGLDPEQRTRVVVDQLRGISAEVFGSVPEQVDIRTPLQKLGLDSLMAAQLRDKIESAMNLEVRIMTIVRGPSIEQLADSMLAQMDAQEHSLSESNP